MSISSQSSSTLDFCRDSVVNIISHTLNVVFGLVDFIWSHAIAIHNSPPRLPRFCFCSNRGHRDALPSEGQRPSWPTAVCALRWARAQPHAGYASFWLQGHSPDEGFGVWPEGPFCLRGRCCCSRQGVGASGACTTGVVGRKSVRAAIESSGLSLPSNQIVFRYPAVYRYPLPIHQAVYRYPQSSVLFATLHFINQAILLLLLLLD